jgi:polyisoprenoid-binding protein YceI
MENTCYILDAKASQFTLEAFAEGLAGIADHRPRFAVRDFSGEVEFSSDKLDGGSLHLAAKSGSLEIMDDVTEHDRRAIDRVMRGEVLHPEKFPEVIFRSERVVCSSVVQNRYRADISGTLSLHGVESQETIQAQLILSDGSLRAYGEFRLRQSGYGLTIASVAGGLLRIKDDLKFVFFFVARKEAGTAIGAAAAQV